MIKRECLGVVMYNSRVCRNGSMHGEIPQHGARRAPNQAFTCPLEFSMRIGVPSETKTLEGRVALVPAACADLVRRGHEVYVQSGAGIKSGFSDEDFAKVGVKIAADADALYEIGELIVKVKEPIKGDL